MSESGKVSVIIPCYNYAHHLEECVESVLGQTYSNWEAIIVDDGSSDNTPEVGATLASRAPNQIKFLRKTNGGVSQARNFAIEHSSGEYILPLDADDKLLPTAIEEFVNAINKDCSIGFSYCPLENFGAFPGEPRYWFPGPCQKRIMLYENLASCTGLWRRSFWEQGVKYRDLIFEDWDLWLQIISKGSHGEYVPEVLLQYRRHPFGRHSQNAHYYFMGLMQVAQLNTEIYPPNIIPLSNLALSNTPECLSLPTIVFLPDPEDPEYHSFSGKMAALANSFLARKHLIIALGQFPENHAMKAGLILRNLPDDKELAHLLEGLRTFGHNILIITNRPDNEIKLLQTGDNVYTPIIFNKAVDNAGIHLVSAEEGYHITDQTKEIDASFDADSTIEYLLSAQEQLYLKKKTEEKEFWSKLSNLNSLSVEELPNDSPDTKDLSVIIPTRNPNPEHLSYSLQSLRSAIGGADIEIRICDLGSNSDHLPSLSDLCKRYSCILNHCETAGSWNKSKALNIGIRKTNRAWTLCLDADMLVNPHLFKVWQLYLEEFGINSLFLLEHKNLLPGQHSLGNWNYGLFLKLLGKAYLPTTTKPSSVFAPTAWLRKIQGFNEALQGSCGQVEELLRRAKLEELRDIWLQSDLLLHQWHLKTIPSKWEWSNDTLKEQYQTSSETRVNSEDWGLVSQEEAVKFLATGPAALRHEEDSSFEKVPSLELMIRQSPGSSSEIVDVLVAWGHHLLQNCHFESARLAFEDALAIDKESLDALEGIMRFLFQKGILGTAGHYACRILKRNPQNEAALQVFKTVITL